MKNNDALLKFCNNINTTKFSLENKKSNNHLDQYKSLSRIKLPPTSRDNQI